METIDQYRSFEQSYLAIRRKEGRVFSDEEVLQLPSVSKGHSLQKEWTIREYSCRGLVKFLSIKKRPLKILEIGCGNGWLCNRLSKIPHAKVTGIDINRAELEQATRLFPKARFIYGSIEDAALNERFDAIVFAAAIQYFSSFEMVIKSCFNYLADAGQIHILDTHFYSEEEVWAAKLRSADYFEESGFPQMDEFYFHHSFSELEAYHYKILYNPRSLTNRIFDRSPFPWICINR
jgi:SAM-dependent methyltransferase